MYKSPCFKINGNCIVESGFQLTFRSLKLQQRYLLETSSLKKLQNTMNNLHAACKVIFEDGLRNLVRFVMEKSYGKYKDSRQKSVNPYKSFHIYCTRLV